MLNILNMQKPRNKFKIYRKHQPFALTFEKLLTEKLTLLNKFTLIAIFCKEPNSINTFNLQLVDNL